MHTANVAAVHGVFLNLFGIGTLLVGKSGAGKSDAALALIDRGHQLIADDMVEFTLANNQTLSGRCPPLLKNLLEVRDLGVLDIAALFGSNAVMPEQQLTLAVQLETSSTPQHTLNVQGSTYPLLGVDVPLFSLSTSIQRPIAVLIENLVRNYQQMQRGTNAAMQFIASHNTLLEIPA